MCGICGFVSQTEIQHDIFVKMNDSLYHRGPDDGGIFMTNYRDAYIGLGHRRLSILDLSEAGHQPMVSSDNSYVIVFNGEIYNYKEIRREIINSRGSEYKFRSECDTEVLLEGFCLWGMDVVKKCNGMFAFAIYNLEDGSITIGRDRLGQKPLYYYWDDKGTFVFSSELKALKRCTKIKLKINSRVIPSYMYRGFITGHETIYENVYRLEQGNILCFKDNTLSKTKYWTLDSRKKTGVSYAEAKNDLKSLLYDAVEKRLIADVPIGSFLSGGIDSSLISAIACDLLDRPLDTYTIKFENRQYDESEYAESIAKKLKTNHHTMTITKEIFDKTIENMAWYFDEPFADPSEIPTMLVSAVAKRDITVALSGDAGDELFGGYDTYASIDRFGKYRIAGKIASRITTFDILKQYLPNKVQMLSLYYNDPVKAIQLWDPERSELVNNICGVTPNTIKFDVDEDVLSDDLIERRMHLDCYSFLSDDILVKVDRASMRYSLEARSPLLDFRVVEYAFSLPNEFKYGDGQRKRILKDILYDLLPSDLFAREKRGFGIPIYEYLQGEQMKKLKYFASESFINTQGIFNFNGIKILMDEFHKGNYSNIRILWHYYMFQLWYCQHIIGV